MTSHVYITINLFNRCQQSFLPLYIYFFKCWHRLNEPPGQQPNLMNVSGFTVTRFCKDKPLLSESNTGIGIGRTSGSGRS